MTRQRPLLDDNADGKATEFGDNEDGRLAKRVYIGSPFQPVPSGPIITAPSLVHIRGWETRTETIWAKVQDPNSLVRAHIKSPEGDPNWVTLSYNPNKDQFEVDYPGFTQPGIYTVTIYAQDNEGFLDFDQSLYIVLMPDAYEPDDTPGQACPIGVNDQAQYHSFHDPNDSDWVYFYAYPNRGYSISAKMRDEGYYARISIYDTQRNLIDDVSEGTVFSTRQNGYYLIRISYPYSSLPNVYPDYDLSVVYSYALNSGSLYGYVKDKDTGEGIPGASVCVISDPNSINGNYPCRTCGEEWYSNDPNDPIGYVGAGFFFFPFGLLLEGTHTISAQALGYTSEAYDISIEVNGYAEKTFYLEMEDPNISPPEIDPNFMLMTVGDIALNREMVKGLEVTLYPGLNLFSYPLDYPSPYYAREFLDTHEPYYDTNGPQWFSGIRCYNKDAGREDTCYIIPSNPNTNTWSIEGSDPNNPLGFPIRYKEGYTIYMNQGKTLSFPFPPPNPLITLKEGTNWIGIPNPPPGYTSHIMLREIGTPEEVMSISGYNTMTGQWESTYWEFGKPGGENFPIITEKGYMVFMKKEKGWLPGEGF